jgi:hypothetical protein
MWPTLVAMVRRQTLIADQGIFSRRSRWIYANRGRTPAVTEHPPPG